MTAYRAAVRLRRVLGLLGAAICLWGAASPMRAAQAAPPVVPAGRRVLVFAMPGVTWADLQRPGLVHLQRLAQQSAVANLAVRVDNIATTSGEGYSTIGAATRAIDTRGFASLVYDRDERFGDVAAVDEFTRRNGTDHNGDVLALGISRLEHANDGSNFEAKLGTLGDALGRSGVGRGVVANADRFDPLDSGAQIHREAGMLLVGSDGTVPCGDVSAAGLLKRDVTAPYGRRLSREAVVAAFDRCWGPGPSVVVVEASDIARARAYSSQASNAANKALMDRALRDSDTLLGALLDHVDLQRDAVVLVAPSMPSQPHLTVFAVHAREFAPGRLVSGQTRQPGYVEIADVGPTIAALAGVDLPVDDIEGRVATLSDSDGSGAQRIADLVDDDQKARFRDDMIQPVTVVHVVLVSALGIIVAVRLARHRTRSRALELVALGAFGVPVCTYLAALAPFHDWGATAYFGFLIAGAVVSAIVLDRFRRSWLMPLVLGYAAFIAVIVLSVVFLHSALQESTVYGDSPIIAGRFAGVNNVTFAQFVIAAAMLAMIAAHMLTGRARTVAVSGVLGFVLLVDIAPMWGADVGGALAGVAGFGAIAMLLLGLRIRIRTALVWVLATVGVVVAFGLFDMTRPSSDQTHLGRLFQRIGGDGISGFTTVVTRKMDQNLRTLTDTGWAWLPIFMTAAALWLLWRSRESVVVVHHRFPELRIALPGLALLALLGYALNDSGIAVPTTMLRAIVPGIAYIVVRTPLADPEPLGDPAPAPSPATVED